MGWARYKSSVLSLTVAPLLLLFFLFSLNPGIVPSSSEECTDYLGGCFISPGNAAPADSPPADELQEVDAYLNESEDPPDPESGTEVLTEGNDTEELPEPEQLPPEQNETGEFQEVDNYLNETTSGEPNNETIEEFVEVDEFLNETLPEEDETLEEETNETEILNETAPNELPINETEPLPEEPNLTIPENETLPEVYTLSESQLIEVPTESIYPKEGSISAEAWIRTTDISDGVIVSTGEYGELESYWTILKEWQGDATTLSIRLNAGEGETAVRGTKNLADGKWHHVVFVRDTENKLILGYVDGEKDLELEDTFSSIEDSSTELMLGNSNPLQNEWFIGEIAGVELYDYALSQGEIQNSYSISSQLFGGEEG